MEKPAKTPLFVCENCVFSCRHRGDWKKHTETIKHKSVRPVTDFEQFANEKTPKKPHYICEICDKTYRSRNGLWGHSKKCKDNVVDIMPAATAHDASSNEIKMLTTLVIDMMKNNQEIQKQMLEIIQNPPANIVTQTHTNSHNKVFSINLFLNEQCKDALNMSEFINSVQVQLSDLEQMGKLGYVNGISRIMLNSLKSLDVYKRPVHCSDAKRETLYIKENNKWEKEGPENTLIKKAIRRIDQKNIIILPKWKELYPSCGMSQSEHNDQYVKIINETMGGKSYDVNTENKIITTIAKEVVIDKSA